MTGKHSGAVTLIDVANEAGVSLATASRALNGSTRKVRDDLRERVLAAARTLDYSTNAQAQAMAKGRSNVVGLVVHDIADPYFSSIAAGVMAAAEHERLVVTVGSTMRRPERELDYIATLRGQRSRAVILAGSRVDDDALRADLEREVASFERNGGHVVVISQQRLPVDTVVVENRAGARALAGELVDLGYRRFGVLAGPRTLLTARDRHHGFRDGLKRNGVDLSPGAVAHGAFTRDGGYEAMSDLLTFRPGLDCVFAVNDVMAVGAMAAAQDRGVALPGDLGVAGFDDIVTLRDVTPRLTTVRLPLEDLGGLALELVLTADDGAHAGPRTRRVSGEVVIRDSTPARR